MRLEFERVTFKNILSYGNKETTYDFQNGIDIISAKNGSGKSTMVDAITFALFGKPFRKIKLGTLVNDKNGKNLLVTLIFKVNNDNFKIIRGQKPNKFEIYKGTVSENNIEYELIDQSHTVREYQLLLEENIIGLNENVFRQLIALGANLSLSKNFMELNSKEKEEVFQIITDTSVFLKMRDKIKEKKAHYKTQETEFEYKVEVLNSSILSSRRNILQMEMQNKRFNNEKDSMIQSLNDTIDSKKVKLDEYNKGIERLKKLKLEYDKLNDDVSKIDGMIEKNQSQMHKHRVNIEISQRNDDQAIICENCKHEVKVKDGIDIANEREMLSHLEKQNGELEKESKPSRERRDKLKEALLNSKRIGQNRNQIIAEIDTHNQELSNVLEWKESKIDYDEVDKQEQDLGRIKEDLLIIKDTLSKYLKIEKIVSDDNLKGFILSKQLPLLNKYINEFIEMFSATEFNFIIDTKFKEQILSRSETKEFNSLSNGQKQRITFSILFSFLKLIETRNGVSTNLLILDEYMDSSLDVEGMDEALRIIFEVFSPTKNVILITHNNDIKSKDEIISRNFSIKRDVFSEMTNITGGVSHE